MTKYFSDESFMLFVVHPSFQNRIVTTEIILILQKKFQFKNNEKQ